MERAEARRVLLCLAEGRHPIFEEDLPGESVCHEVDVVRALMMGVRELERKPARPPRARSGKPWTEAEEGSLREGHEAGRSPRELADALDRSPGAVEARLVRLGLMEPSSSYRFRA